MTRFLFSILFASSVLTTPQASWADTGDCQRELVGDESLGLKVATIIEKDLREKGHRGREVRGYSILIATMIASAAATTYVSASLPPDLQFISFFLTQVSTLGVYVFGAPIWEPLSSGFRKMAFGVRRAELESPHYAVDMRKLEGLWRKTQENYSLNEQMSRNVVTQFLISVHQNFYEAYRAAGSDNRDYAAAQIAEAAVRLRTLFRDIDPDDRSVVGAVKTAFVDHVSIDHEFLDQVMLRVRALDKYAESETANVYYARLFRAWLGMQL
ncbi:MAG: hypothetical protein KF799_13335 [Bdellovibrionales bacterium]|nr:hypothetical protein [Bdellovibrionales bacterium]